MRLVILCIGCGFAGVAPDWWQTIAQHMLCPKCGTKSLRVGGKVS